MKTNVREAPLRTHEGAPAKRISEFQALERSVMSCLLWEREFYESGESIADRISSLVKACCEQGLVGAVHDLALKAREAGLRHAPLWLLVSIPKGFAIDADVVYRVTDRADQMGELISLWFKSRGRKAGLTRSIKEGIARRFGEFDEYSLAKYDRDGAIKLRDVLFLCHVKPLDAEHKAMFERVIDRTLKTPDTWETALSSGQDKKATWTRLLNENALGALALIRNLRNMIAVDVDRALIRTALEEASVRRIFPFQILAAGAAAPEFEDELEQLAFKAAADLPKLPGRTAIVVDISGSMDTPLSSRGTMTCRDAAIGTAMVAREICESVVVVAYGTDVETLKPRRGFALRDEIVSASIRLGHATMMGAAIKHAQNESGVDRVICFTDEQSHDRVPDPVGRGYIVNVASAENGVGYGAWNHIDGFSSSLLKFIPAIEGLHVEGQVE